MIHVVAAGEDDRLEQLSDADLDDMGVYLPSHRVRMLSTPYVGPWGGSRFHSPAMSYVDRSFSPRSPSRDGSVDGGGSIGYGVGIPGGVGGPGGLVVAGGVRRDNSRGKRASFATPSPLSGATAAASSRRGSEVVRSRCL